MTTHILRRNRNGPPIQQAEGTQEELRLRRVQEEAATPPPAPPVKLLVLAAGGYAALVAGDAATAAAIAGAFSVVNVVLTAWLARRLDHTRRELAGPRRILLDEDDRPVAAVAVRADDDVDSTLHPRRRTADHMTRRRTD